MRLAPPAPTGRHTGKRMVAGDRAGNYTWLSRSLRPGPTRIAASRNRGTYAYWQFH